MGVATVTMKHIRADRLCSGGTRKWFVAHGFNWSDFLKDGIAADTLAATGDPMTDEVCRMAREDAANER